MAQPTPSPNRGTLPPSSYRPVSDTPVDLVAQIAADRTGIEIAAAAPALVGAEPAKFDFQAKISEAYEKKRSGKFQESKTLFLEILEHAKSSDCPAEFAKYSLYYVNCLVGLAETEEDPSERLKYAKQALHQVDQMLGKPTTYPEIPLKYNTLLSYVKRVESFVSDPKYKENCSSLLYMLKEKCAKENPLEAPAHAHPTAPTEARKVTPTDPSKGSSTMYRLFFLFFGLFLAAGVVTLYRRHIVQINSPSK